MDIGYGMGAAIMMGVGTLEAELPTNCGIEIRPAQAGHMVTIEIRTSTLNHRMTISTNYSSSSLDGVHNDDGNKFYTLEEYKSWSFDPKPYESKKKYESPEDVLRIVVDAIGKEIAQRDVLSERETGG